MQLKVSENIKRYRKSMDLTQEELAEALGVTIGAVSKWENGNNVPDITTLMELANLYNISMDELLGYDKSAKNIDALAERIENLTHEHRYDEAVLEAKNALARYPHTFKILHTCAQMYAYKYVESRKITDCEESISLFERALSYISQNTNTDINEFTIKLQIANLYSEKDPEKALEELKRINYNGINDTAISHVLMSMGKYRESLDFGTRALLRSFVSQYTTVNKELEVASLCEVVTQIRIELETIGYVKVLDLIVENLVAVLSVSITNQNSYVELVIELVTNLRSYNKV